MDLFNTDNLEKVRKMTAKRANNLDGKTWTKYSISIWNDIRKTKEELNLHHPAMFPIQLAQRIMECFCNSTDKLILDPFSGSGTAILAAENLGKAGIGIDLSQEYTDMASKRLGQQAIFGNNKSKSKFICDDAFNLNKYIKPNSIDFVVTSPPYWDILSQKRSADYHEKREYKNGDGDLGKISDYQLFIKSLKNLFTLIYKVLKKNKYCVINVMDIRKKDKFYPLHSDLAEALENIGFIYDDIIIWDRRSEYNNLRPLGYPAVFRINKIHEYLLIFKKG